MRSLCYLGTYEADYERNRILAQALASADIAVDTCHEAVWDERRHKTGALSSPMDALTLAASAARAYLRLARRYVRSAEHDAALVGYLGHLDAILLAPLCRLRGEPLVFDAFISLYDTLVNDRRIFAEGSPAAKALRLVDRLSCAMADVVLCDTDAHVDYFVRELGVRRDKCLRVLVGADPAQYHPPDGSEPALEDDGRFTVFTYAKFAPLHGARTILEAAALLKGEADVHFVLVGSGQLGDDVDAWIDELGLDDVTRHQWMEPATLRAHIAKAGACLGIFGDTDKAARVIPNKVYQCMAVGAPIITRDSPGVRELMVDGEHLLLTPPADPRALADAILRLRDDPALGASLAEHARALFEARCTPDALGRELREALWGPAGLLNG